MYSLYFQAQVNKKETWFLAATLRSFEHLAFDRTVDKQAGIFEFFVTPHLEEQFVQLMNYYLERGIITWFKKMPNRLKSDQLID